MIYIHTTSTEDTALSPYCVMLHEEKGDKFQIRFDCMADDGDHAADQALNAYPGGEVLSTTVIDERDYMTPPY